MKSEKPKLGSVALISVEVEVEVSKVKMWRREGEREGMLDLDIHTSRQHPEDGDDWHRELQKRRLWLVDIKEAAPSPHVPHNALLLLASGQARMLGLSGVARSK